MFDIYESPESEEDAVETAKAVLAQRGEDGRCGWHEIALSGELDESIVEMIDEEILFLEDGARWTVAHYLAFHAGLPERFHTYDILSRQRVYFDIATPVAHLLQARHSINVREGRPDPRGHWISLVQRDERLRVADIPNEYGTVGHSMAYCDDSWMPFFEDVEAFLDTVDGGGTSRRESRRRGRKHPTPLAGVWG